MFSSFKGVKSSKNKLFKINHILLWLLIKLDLFVLIFRLYVRIVNELNWVEIFKKANKTLKIFYNALLNSKKIFRNEIPLRS